MGRKRIAALVGAAMYAGIAAVSSSLTAGAAASAVSWSTDQSIAYQVDGAHSGGQPNDSLAPPLIQGWTHAFSGPVSYPLIAAGHVYVTVAGPSSGAGYGTQLFALDQATGAVLWGPVDLGGTYFWSNATYAQGRVFTVNFDGALSAFDAATGALDWRTQLLPYLGNWFQSPPTAFGGMVFVTGGSGTAAVDQSTGTLVWQGTGGGSGSTSPAVSASGVYTSYACNSDTDFEPQTGHVLWRYSTNCSGGGGKTAVLYGGKLYTRDYATGNLILDAQAGTLQGTYTAAPAPAFSGSTRFTLAGGLVATDVNSNSTLWTFTGDGTLDTAPIVVHGTVYEGSSSGKLYALDAVTGSQLTGSPFAVPGVSPPDEQSLTQPLTGLGAGEGWLDVPAGNNLVAFTSALAVAPGDLDFGTQATGTSSAPATVTITNHGAASATLSAFAAGGDFSETNNCSSPLGTGASCSADVTFSPTASGLRTGTLTFTDSVTGAHSVPLAGNVINGFPPGQPTNLAAIPGLNAIRLSWTAPPNGGSPITGYTITQTPGGTTTVGGGTTSVLINGLNAGTTYSFQVTATNSNGSSQPASTSALVALGSAGEIITQAGVIGVGPALSVAQAPYALALNGTHLYVADGANPVLRDIDLNTGQEGVLAGNDGFGYRGDGMPATAAMIEGATAVAHCGAVTYFADTFNFAIRAVDSSGIISTVAGSGVDGYSGDGGPATSARLSRVLALACRSAGGLYIADSDNGAIRILDQSGRIATWWKGFSFPTGLLEVAPGVVDVSDAGADDAVWQFTNTAYSLIAGTPGSAGYGGDGGPAVYAQLSYPAGLALWGSSLLIADTLNNRVRMVTSGGSISTLAGNSPATALSEPIGLAINSTTLFVASLTGNQVNVLPLGGAAVGTLAGNGFPSSSGDGGPAAGAQIGAPYDIAFDPLGNEYVVDNTDATIRKITTAGVITTVAGTGTYGFNGDRTALTTQFDDPRSVAVDAAGNIFVSDTGNQRIRKISQATGMVTTVAGNGVAGFNGDGFPATGYELNSPRAIRVDSAGNLFIADTANHRIRKLTPAGALSTFAGTGIAGFAGDGGQAVSAQLNGPRGLAIDAAGNLFISDTWNERVREVSTAGVITTVVGTGVSGYGADNVPALQAQLAFPFGLAFDPSGNLYIADADNSRIRVLDGSGVIHTVVNVCGGTPGFSGDGALASTAEVNFPFGLAVDALGDLFVADVNNNRVRETTSLVGARTASCPSPSGTPGSRGANPSAPVPWQPPPPRIFDAAATRGTARASLPVPAASSSAAPFKPVRSSSPPVAPAAAPVTRPRAAATAQAQTGQHAQPVGPATPAARSARAQPAAQAANVVRQAGGSAVPAALLTVLLIPIALGVLLAARRRRR